MSADETQAGERAPLVMGVDLGGTQIRAAILRGGEIIARAAALTGTNPTPERVLPRMYATMREALAEARVQVADLAGIGVAAPGPLDNREGVLYAPPNLPAWQATPLRDILAREFGVPVYLENDANAAALGEYLYGAGQGSRDMVYLTVSTGIGGGIIANGQILEGANGTAGELGHITIDYRGERCSCGNVGCLEALASGTGIARKANQAIARGEAADLLTFARTMAEHPASAPDKQAMPTMDFSTQPLHSGQLSAPAQGEEELTVTAQTVARAAEAGVPGARAIIGEAAQALGFGLVNILHIFSPEILILGGGVMQMGALILEPALKVVEEHTMKANKARTRIVMARLGGNAGLIGAGALSEYYQKNQ